MFDLISFLIFISLIVFIIYRDRKKLKLEGIFLLRRTKKGRNFIDNFTKKHTKFVKIFSILGISLPYLLC